MELIKRYLEENGWNLVDNHKEADLIICVGCASNMPTQNYVLKEIEKIRKEMKPESTLIVGGCLPDIKRDLKYVTFGIRSMGKLDGYLHSKVPISEITAPDFNTNVISKNKMVFRLRRAFNESPLFHLVYALFSYRLPIERITEIDHRLHDFSDDSAFITLGIGCLGNCTYCAIKHSIGGIKSRSEKEILSEVRCRVGEGYKKIFLLGDDVGSYGRDIGKTFTGLLNKILQLGDFDIGVDFLSPNHLRDKSLRELLKNRRIKIVKIPIQSGSDRILKEMNRGYTSQEFVKYVKEITFGNNGIRLYTDVIVGFPGETEEDFKSSMDVIDKTGLYLVAVCPYSDVQDTPASKRQDKLPEEVIRKRDRELHLFLLKQHIKRLAG